jgi:trehalose/maltose hydrolase-like predicted phosphorylase
MQVFERLLLSPFGDQDWLLIVEGDDEAQRALRFAIYHLIAATKSADEHVSIGARGLTGEAYRGHVFWDTEICGTTGARTLS